MKKIILMLGILTISLTLWGSVVIVYANGSHTRVQVTPTPIPTQVIVDKPATVSPQIKGSVFSQGSSNQPEIALTFDDGPSPLYTPQILNILHDNGVHATFFCIGEQVQNSPDLVQQEAAAGHVVANHSWDHPDLTTLTDDQVHAQLADTSNALQSADGQAPVFFRPPYGAINEDVQEQAATLGLQPILWNIDTLDWELPGSAAIVQTALDNASNGAVILMHDGGGDRSQTVAALPEIISGLKARGFQLVTINQLVNDAQKDDTAVSTSPLAITQPGSVTIADLTHERRAGKL